MCACLYINTYVVLVVECMYVCIYMYICLPDAGLLETDMLQI